MESVAYMYTLLMSEHLKMASRYSYRFTPSMIDLHKYGRITFMFLMYLSLYSDGTKSQRIPGIANNQYPQMRIGGQGCVTCPLTRERHPLVILQTVSSKKFWKKFCRYNPTDNIIVGNNVLIIVKHYGSIFRIDENRLIL